MNFIATKRYYVKHSHVSRTPELFTPHRYNIHSRSMIRLTKNCVKTGHGALTALAYGNFSMYGQVPHVIIPS